MGGFRVMIFVAVLLLCLQADAYRVPAALREGQEIQLQVFYRQWIGVNNDNVLVANAGTPSQWETFSVHLVDDKHVQLKAKKNGMWLTAENGGGGMVVANRSVASGWETFEFVQINTIQIQLRAFGGQWLTADQGGNAGIRATASQPSGWETFTVQENGLRGVNIGGWLIPERWMLEKGDRGVNTVYAGTSMGDAPDLCSLVRKIGRAEATRRMNAHRSSFITQSDFAWLADNGINTVRLPFGYWDIESNVAEYVDGGQSFIDAAFKWAEIYGIRILLDLHGAPGGQSADQCGGCASAKSWGTGDTVAHTLSILETVAKNYGSNPFLFGIQLLNEPHAYGDGCYPPNTGVMPTSQLTQFYWDAYFNLRKYTNAHIVYHDAFCGIGHWNGVLENGKNTVYGAVRDTHRYTAWSKHSDLQGVINEVNSWRGDIQGNCGTGSNLHNVCIMGEWSLGATLYLNDGDLMKYAEAELSVIDDGMYGHMFWSYKHLVDNRGWDFRRIKESGIWPR
eukprot:Colp12_sorted_trinity150504_noHs@12194